MDGGLGQGSGVRGKNQHPRVTDKALSNLQHLIFCFQRYFGILRGLHRSVQTTKNNSQIKSERAITLPGKTSSGKSDEIFVK